MKEYSNEISFKAKIKPNHSCKSDSQQQANNLIRVFTIVLSSISNHTKQLHQTIIATSNNTGDFTGPSAALIVGTLE